MNTPCVSGFFGVFLAGNDGFPHLSGDWGLGEAGWGTLISRAGLVLSSSMVAMWRVSSSRATLCFVFQAPPEGICPIPLGTFWWVCLPMYALSVCLWK